MSAGSASTPTWSEAPSATSSSACRTQTRTSSCPGVDHAGLRAALEQHGRVEDMEVHGQLVGVRLHPNDREIRALAPAGIDITAPRSRAFDQARATAISRSSVTPGSRSRRTWRGATSPSMRSRSASPTERCSIPSAAYRTRPPRLRTVSPASFREDPLRILRGAAVRLPARLRPVGGCRGSDADRGTRPRDGVGRADRRRHHRRRARRACRSSCSGTNPHEPSCLGATRA